MPQYNYNYNSESSQPTPPPFTHNPVMTQDVQKSVLEAYGWMFGGLLLTGATAFLFDRSGLLMLMLMHMPSLVMLLPIAQIALVIAFTFSMAKASANTLRVLFIVYALTLGISLSGVFSVYTDGVIYAAFLICALYYGCLVFIGWTTKKDLTKLGTLLVGALFVMIISQFLLALFGFGMNTRVMAIVGLLLFTGITAWDVQRLNKTMLYSQGEPVAQKKWAIYFALELYLDFINIFLYILRLVGAGSSKN